MVAFYWIRISSLKQKGVNNLNNDNNNGVVEENSPSSSYILGEAYLGCQANPPIANSNNVAPTTASRDRRLMYNFSMHRGAFKTWCAVLHAREIQEIWAY
jgi:hypothetical protein